MKVYITYDRYENNEWFNIYQITTDFKEVKRDYQENLKKFISSGPDDCHSYQIQVVDMTEEEYNKLVSLSNQNNRDLLNIMIPIYQKLNDSNCLLSTDGCSDNDHLAYYYCTNLGYDPDDEDTYYDCETELFEDDDLYQEILSLYIEDNYSL